MDGNLNFTTAPPPYSANRFNRMYSGNGSESNIERVMFTWQRRPAKGGGSFLFDYFQVEYMSHSNRKSSHDFLFIFLFLIFKTSRWSRNFFLFIALALAVVEKWTTTMCEIDPRDISFQSFWALLLPKVDTIEATKGSSSLSSGSTNIY